MNNEMLAGDAVNAAARDVLAAGMGWGERKAFVVDVFDRLQRFNPSLTLDGLKALLVELLRDGAVSLSRADLPEAMPTHLVRRSEIATLGSTYHFVVVG